MTLIVLSTMFNKENANKFLAYFNEYFRSNAFFKKIFNRIFRL